MSADFIESVRKHQNAFGLNLSEENIEALNIYYEFVQEHNDILHLVAPAPAEDFAVRHILESLTLLEHLPPDARLVDVGAGAGLPSIPCLVARPDLSVVLVESKAKKAVFLAEAAAKLNVSRRVTIINKQFEEAQIKNISFVTCRALDKFTEKLPKLLKWSGDSTRLFFGGENLAEALRKNKTQFTRRLMPLSERRFLFIAEKSKRRENA